MSITRISSAVLPVLAAAPTLTIHSVFDTSVYLRAGPRLVICVGRELGAPHGVELTGADLRRLRDHGRAHPAETLYWNTCRWQIATATGTLTLRAGAKRTVFDPQLSVPGPFGWAAGVAELTAELTRRRPETGLGSDWPALLEDRRVTGAVAALATGRVDDPVRHWLGRGPGLTPTGDDILVGALAALFSTGRRTGDPAAPLCERLATAAAVTTTEISAEYLRYACRGMVVRPVHRLLAAVHGGQRAAVSDAVTALTRYGHTSGLDTTLGLLAALRDIAPDHPGTGETGAITPIRDRPGRFGRLQQ